MRGFMWAQRLKGSEAQRVARIPSAALSLCASEPATPSPYNARAMKRSLPLVLFLLASACASWRKPAEPVHVVIVGTTDVHGWFNGHVETPPNGGEGVLWGGLPVLATHVEV